MSRDDFELGGRVAGAMAGENNRGHKVARKVIVRRGELAERGGRQPRRPSDRRPKHHRAVAALTCLGLVFVLAGCVLPPEGVDIGDPLRVTADEPPPDPWVYTNCEDLNLFPFVWVGPSSHLPEGCRVIGVFATGPADPTAPLLQGAAGASSVPPVTRGPK